jgi:hypothetical protein
MVQDGWRMAGATSIMERACKEDELDIVNLVVAIGWESKVATLGEGGQRRSDVRTSRIKKISNTM